MRGYFRSDLLTPTLSRKEREQSYARYMAARIRPLGICSDLIYSGFMDMAMTTATVLSRTQPAIAGRAVFAIPRASLLSLRLLLP